MYTNSSYEIRIRVCVTLIDVGPTEVDIACPQGPPFVTTQRRRKYMVLRALISPALLGMLSRCIKFKSVLTGVVLTLTE